MSLDESANSQNNEFSNSIRRLSLRSSPRITNSKSSERTLKKSIP